MSSHFDGRSLQVRGRIVHMTSVHPRHDVRVFVKECGSLVAAGFDVTLVVADGKGDDAKAGVAIRDVGRAGQGRLARVLLTTRRVYQAARKLRADIYHFHDPELIPWAILLRLAGFRVVYDVHEHVPHDILSKPYLSKSKARFLAWSVGWLELTAARIFSAIVAATPDIADRFSGYARQCVGVFNFPLVSELASETPWNRRQAKACYVGLISGIRGANEVATAAAKTRAHIVFAGPIVGDLLAEAIRSSETWRGVEYVGLLDRTQVADLMATCRAGIVTFLPELNHVNALPNKLFEYMSAGLPVVASNFVSWREIVEVAECGLCVDPADPSAIAKAIDRLTEDSEFARACGANGARAVRERFNWESQAANLLSAYERLLAPRSLSAERA